MTAWAHEGAAHSPILAAISVESDSGKSTLLGVLRFLVPKPFVSVEPTGPSVYVLRQCGGRSCATKLNGLRGDTHRQGAEMMGPCSIWRRSSSVNVMVTGSSLSLMNSRAL